MARPKKLPKFKYTSRKNGKLYARVPVPGAAYPIWREVPEETQESVDVVIKAVREEYAVALQGKEIPNTCAKFFDFWLKLIKKSVTDVSYQAYEIKVRLYLKPALGNLALEEVKPAHLQNLYLEMAETLESATIKKAHSVAKAIFNEAVHQELIIRNPVEKVKVPRSNQNAVDKIKWLSPQEAKAFLNECRSSQHGALFIFAMETGARPQEVCALRWSDIDFKRKRVSIVRAVVFDQKGGGFYFKEPKTKKSRRSCPLSDKLIEILKVHRADQIAKIKDIEARIEKRCKPSRENRKSYNRAVLFNAKEYDLVFPSSDFTPIKAHNLTRRYFRPIAERVGLSKDLSPKSLRHTCATLLLTAGINPKIVSERLGHSNIQTTLNVYSHVIPNMQESATDKIADAIYG